MRKAQSAERADAMWRASMLAPLFVVIATIAGMM